MAGDETVSTGQRRESKAGSEPPSPGNDTENGGGRNAADEASRAKRRKVSRACVYCRRSHMTCDSNRPCLRCIKRDIGHWCRDEPREPTKKKSISQTDSNGHAPANENGHSASEAQALPPSRPQSSGKYVAHPGVKDAAMPDPKPKMSQGPAPSITAPIPVNNQTASAASEWLPGLQNQFHDMHSLHPSYMFNAHEVSNEYNLLNDFLSTSLLEDGNIFGNENPEAVFGFSTAGPSPNLAGQEGQQGQSSLMLPPSASGENITRPSSTIPNDKAKEQYYLTAADPTGNDAPEARINKLLQAKYDAGLLKPFNYIRGYARLNKYMEEHMQPQNKNRVLRQLDKFRPKFRERMQRLTDVELILVEMWFERTLMEYDRVFASMAVPACCWRRTGEIFRGNKEMAQLVDVPLEKLRDGKISIQEIMVEDSLVNYWERFNGIAFDRERKGMLTSCSVKNPDTHHRDAGIACCFSFTVRRDEFNIPTLIVGNFLPMQGRGI